MGVVVERWMDRVNSHERIPADYNQRRQQQPDLAILQAAGFEFVGSYSFRAVHEWTPEALVGYVFSTSVLSREALGRLAPDLEADLHRVLGDHRLTQAVDSAYVLCGKPK